MAQISPDVSASSRLIVALDTPTADDAMEIVDELGDAVSFYKVGYQLFIAEGLPFINKLKDMGKKVFLDLKMDDVGETIKLAVEKIAGNGGIEFITIQGSGATAKAAFEGRGDNALPKILFVTFLSSRNQDDLNELFAGGNVTFEEYLHTRAETALESGSDGFIASGESVRQFRNDFSEQNPLIVTPGIRPGGSTTDDHKRSLTPYEAIMAGSDYLVVGRPITKAPDRKEAALKIIKEIENALNDADRQGQ